MKESSLKKGVAIIAGHARRLEDTPGVYRMMDEKGQTLYVGKAKSLKKRVASYAKTESLSVRIRRMIALTCSMEFTQTGTEAEALLLESNLIKKLKPRYNILLRDDKSFPTILLTQNHDFPMLRKHRGAKKDKGLYYGPFAGTRDVDDTIAILRRVFMLRNCTDNYFAARKRPCLQYHIRRCTAPCVGKVTKAQYAAQAAEAKDFLEGKSRSVQERTRKIMDRASAALDYEIAALCRDKIAALASVQAHQDINVRGLGDADVVALAEARGTSCIEVFFFRAGRNHGNRPYFPRHDPEEKPEDIMAAFLAQFYENKPLPPRILVSHAPQEKALLEEALSSRAGRRVRVTLPRRGAGRNVLGFALKNARASLARHLADREGNAQLLGKVAKLFGLDAPPRRIEVYDNSHIAGTQAVGAMIAAGPEGFLKNSYRKFNIRDAAASDDVGMMREVLARRFSRAIKDDPDRRGEDWPDLILIDGGQGQLNAVREVLEDMGLLENVKLVAIAKGEDRNAGRERFFMAGKKPFRLPVNDPVLHYLQRLRDEAHRFAVGAHRTRRKMQAGRSLLDEIPGIGAKRKKILLRHFGSAKAVAEAGIRDLEKAEGISKAFARRIHDYFR